MLSLQKLNMHAVINTLEELASKGMIKLSYVDLDKKGNVNLEHLKKY